MKSAGKSISKSNIILKMKTFIFFIILVFLFSCKQTADKHSSASNDKIFFNTPFIQEYHDAYMISDNKSDNEVRSIAVDQDFNVWIAASSGAFVRYSGKRIWEPVIQGTHRGPAYSVLVSRDGSVLIGTWNGLYRYRNNRIIKEEGIEPPVSVICRNESDTWALGPYGAWKLKGNVWERLNFRIARSVRDAVADGKGGLWIATDVGLYHCNDRNTVLYQDTSELISSYVRGVDLDSRHRLWAGGLGGVTIREEENNIQKLTPCEGIPSAFVNCITCSPGGVMWIGTDVGVVRFREDGNHSLLFSRRWLTDDKVNDIAFDADGNAWVATQNGVSAIKQRMMTLAEKERYFYDLLMRRHIRPPWTAGICDLTIPGDTSSWIPSDDDNDGEYTGGYLAMESFRYAVTGDEDARLKARKAFDFLRFLHEVTGTEGFFARSVIPADWERMHDPNRTYDEKQIADELVRDPRYKPVETRWRKSSDGKWLWKGDTSSDEMDGHMMAYFYYYELAAGDEDRILIREHVKKIIDRLIQNNHNLIDVDGTHTRWGVWSPDLLNRDAEWAPERSLNSLELLAFLKFASHITGDEKYETEYIRLIRDERYLDNASGINSKNPAWQIYFDLTLEGYIFPILIKYENDPELKQFYINLIDEWIEKQEAGENLINNLIYTYARGKKVNVSQTIEFLKDTPLDLVDWTIDHTLREDVKIVRNPILEEVQVEELPPANIRATVRWDKNPWAAVQGNPHQEREPVFWLWPYWMSRYLGVIEGSKH